MDPLVRTTSFSSVFDEVYAGIGRGGTKSATLSKALREAEARVLDAEVRAGVEHPDYEHLAVGDTEQGTPVVYFMDMRGCTKLAMAMDLQDLVRLLQTVLATTVLSLERYEGRLHDLTGDGVMAIFGSRGSATSVDAMHAVSAAAYIMQGMQEVVQTYLESKGLPPVEIGMGIEYGEVLWTRLGLPHASQVKPIGGIAFLAGKLCSGGYTKAWECKVGERLGEFLPDRYRALSDPFKFEQGGQQYTYDVYQFDWERYHRDYVAQPLTLEHVVGQRALPAPVWPGPVTVPETTVPESPAEVVLRPSVEAVATPAVEIRRPRSTREAPPFA